MASRKGIRPPAIMRYYHPQAEELAKKLGR
jgi:predicted RecB family endonuclease